MFKLTCELAVTQEKMLQLRGLRPAGGNGALQTHYDLATGKPDHGCPDKMLHTWLLVVEQIGRHLKACLLACTTCRH